MLAGFFRWASALVALEKTCKWNPLAAQARRKLAESFARNSVPGVRSDHRPKTLPPQGCRNPVHEATFQIVL
jgi:hypothetical protein